MPRRADCLNQCSNTRQTSSRKPIYFLRSTAGLNRDAPLKQTGRPGKQAGPANHEQLEPLTTPVFSDRLMLDTELAAEKSYRIASTVSNSSS